MDLLGRRWLADDEVHPLLKRILDVLFLGVPSDSGNERLLDSIQVQMSLVLHDQSLDILSDLLSCSRTVFVWHIAVHKDDVEHIAERATLDLVDCLLAGIGLVNLVRQVDVRYLQNNLHGINVEGLVVNNQNLWKICG